MTRNVRFVSPGTTVEAAMALMHVNRHRHLLVIDGPTVHGLVSMRDLVYQLVRRGPQGFAAALQNIGGFPMSTLPSPARRAALAAGLGSFALLAAGCGERGRFFALPAGRAQTFHGLTMGSSYTVKIAGPALSATALAAAQSAVAQALGEVVARMSHYDADSEVSRLNRQPLGRPLAVSAPTLQVFEVAQAVRAASDGAFDVAVGRAVDEWGFGPSEPSARRAAG